MEVKLPPENVRRTARIGTAVQHAILVVGDDGTHRARLPDVVVPPVHVMAALRKLVAHAAVDPRLDLQPRREIRMRLERAGIAVSGEARP